MAIVDYDDPITNSESSEYVPVSNQEQRSLSRPPWINQNGEYVEPIGLTNNDELRIGGAKGSKPSDNGIGVLMNSFQTALANRNVAEMKQVNTSINNLTRSMVHNVLMTRANWMFEHMLDPRGRDLFRECGYPLAINAQMYREMYDRDGIAQRVVNIWPSECWEQPPQVYETEDENDETDFERAWKDLQELHRINHFMERIDILSGIGSYGLMLIGIDDGKGLNEPIDGLDPDTGELANDIKPHKLLYLRTFDESLCHVGRWNTNQQSPRYAQPDVYLIRFLDYTIVPVGQTVTDVITHMVHWSRVVHVADNRKSSEVFGLPRMKDVFNRLLDLRKIYGGSAEMFWKGGFPGIALEVLPELADAEIDQATIREQMDAYQNSLRRYFAVAGMTAKTLEVEVADPEPHIRSQLQAVSVAKGVPLRVFLGSEQAVKAGEQDSDAWDTRLQRRKENYLTPMVVRPVVERFIAMGIMPEPDKQFHVNWPDSSSPTAKDKAAIAASFANALAAYMNSSGDQIMTPLDFLIEVCFIDRVRAIQIIENAKEYAVDMQQQAGMNALPAPEDLADALGMDVSDAEKIITALADLMQQQQAEPAEESDNTGGTAYEQQPAVKEEATGQISGGYAGGIGSSGVDGTMGATPWTVGGPADKNFAPPNGKAKTKPKKGKKNGNNNGSK